MSNNKKEQAIYDYLNGKTLKWRLKAKVLRYFRRCNFFDDVEKRRYIFHKDFVRGK